MTEISLQGLATTSVLPSAPTVRSEEQHWQWWRVHGEILQSVPASTLQGGITAGYVLVDIHLTAFA